MDYEGKSNPRFPQRRAIDPSIIREIKRKTTAGEMALGKIPLPGTLESAKICKIHVDRLAAMHIDLLEVADLLQQRDEHVAPRGCQRLASVIRFAQIEAATAQGPNGRQGVDHIPEITAMEKRLQRSANNCLSRSAARGGAICRDSHNHGLI